MNVLVYSGPGTTTESVKHTLESLRLHLSPHYAVVAVTDSTIINEPWTFKTAMLVMPGGADLPMCQTLNGTGTKKIIDYVKKGGKYVGFCAGGYFAAARCEFEVGTPMEVSGPRQLGFFPGTARGCAYKGFEYDTHQGSRAVELTSESCSPLLNYYNGGGIFVDADTYSNTKVLARYPSDTHVTDSGNAAVILCSVGKGKALLSGTHPEFTTSLMKPQANDLPFVKTYQDLSSAPIYEHNRKIFLRDCLKELGLKVNESVEMSAPQITPTYIASLKPAVLAKLAHELPDFLEDANDKFQFKKVLDFENESLVEEAYEGSPEDAVKQVKLLVTGTLPPHKLTPYFNMTSCFNHMKALWISLGKPEQEIGSIGSTLGYTEVVTSTNTLLDKNPGWLKLLPHGFTMTATTQVSGRGRSGNVWVNPKGVLATSVLFKIPAKEAKIVTLQYLCGLAIVESILGYGSTEAGSGVGYEDMPVKLKWPNDIYAMKPDHFTSIGLETKPTGTVEGDEQNYAKISGALINTQFLEGMFHLVWGVGINVSNSAPTTSLNLVLAQLNKLRAAKGLPELPPYQDELLLAKMLFTVEQFYSVFIHAGLKPFLPLFYKRWFHSGQIVDVDDGNTIRKCRIDGITPDYGLLMVQDLNNGERLELQPDGNSFDIFKGLIYKKS